jgi:hypothetical protein
MVSPPVGSRSNGLGEAMAGTLPFHPSKQRKNKIEKRLITEEEIMSQQIES